MRKKLLTTLALLLMAVSGAWALTPNGSDTWDEGTKTLTVNSNPDISSYSLKTEIEHLVISAGVTTIATSAFEGCTNLTSVTFDGVSMLTSIGSGAFRDSGLTSIEIPASVTTIGNYAFNNCSGLTSVTFDGVSTLTSIGSGAFRDSGLTSIEIPASMTTIENSVFCNCSSLTSVTFAAGSTLESIGISAFCNTGLTSIEIPASVTSIGNYAFHDCSSLTSVTFASGSLLESIGDSAFRGTGLTSISIPASVTRIGKDAFEDCSSLTSVTIPASVTRIGSYAFNNCSGLTSVIIHATSLNMYGAFAFHNNKDGRKIYVPSTAVGTYQTNWSSYTSDIEAMAANGTCGASGHESEVIWSLTGTSPNYALTISGTGAMADYADGNSVPWASNQADITSVVIENGVTTIGNYAFYYCRNLTSVSIPAGVTSIGDYAFIYCGLNAATNLTVTISGSSLTTIGREAFSLANLKSITIPASVTSIGFAAFNNCGNLETMTLNSNPTLGAGALDGFKAGAVVTMNLTGHEGDTGEYWMTFYNRNYSFTADGNTTIYKAAVNSGNTAVVLTEVDDIPFANAAVLKSSNATITMTLAASASADYSDNELEGSDSPIVANAGDDIYCLSKETSGSSPRGVGFYTFTGTIPANRAYLEVPGGPTTARGFLGFSDDDNTTDIEAIDHSPLTIDHSVYDLSGRLVIGQPQKGIYVKNGKKVVIK